MMAVTGAAELHKEGHFFMYLSPPTPEEGMEEEWVLGCLEPREVHNRQLNPWNL
jgi:hypothetical protein